MTMTALLLIAALLVSAATLYGAVRIYRMVAAINRELTKVMYDSTNEGAP